MITAVDTSVILDVLVDDPHYAAASETALRKARAEGKLVVCECVVAEIVPALTAPTAMEELLRDWALEYEPLTKEAAIAAGENFARYLKRGGQAKRVLPDFLIGAHAEKASDRLLARDRGYLRDYFSSLTLWDPSAG